MKDGIVSWSDSKHVPNHRQHRFILRGDLFYVLPCVILFLCFSVLLALRLPRLGKRELILVLFFCTCLDFCRFPLPLSVWEGLRFVIVVLLGLFSYFFFYTGTWHGIWLLLSVKKKAGSKLFPKYALVMLNKSRYHPASFQPIRLLTPACWYKFTYVMTHSVEPDQSASSVANWSGSTLFAKAVYIRVQQEKG